MNDQPYDPAETGAQPAAPASQPDAQAAQPIALLNDATATTDAVGDARAASVADERHPATHATHTEPQAAQETILPVNEQPATDAISDARDAVADAPAALVDARTYNLTVGQAQQCFMEHRRRVPSERTIQDYCAKGQVDGQKVSTSTGQEWLINEQSLLAFIAIKPELTGVAATEPNPRPTAGAPAAASPAPEANVVVTGEQRSLADMLIENSRLVAELHGSRDLNASKDEMIAELRDNAAFLREEIADKRRLNQDLKEITARVFDLLDSMVDARNPHLQMIATDVAPEPAPAAAPPPPAARDVSYAPPHVGTSRPPFHVQRD